MYALLLLMALLPTSVMGSTPCTEALRYITKNGWVSKASSPLPQGKTGLSPSGPSSPEAAYNNRRMFSSLQAGPAVNASSPFLYPISGTCAGGDIPKDSPLAGIYSVSGTVFPVSEHN